MKSAHIETVLGPVIEVDAQEAGHQLANAGDLETPGPGPGLLFRQGTATESSRLAA